MWRALTGPGLSVLQPAKATADAIATNTESEREMG